MQRRNKMLAILTAGTAVTAAVGLAHHAPPAHASLVSEAPAINRAFTGMHLDELSAGARVARLIGEGTLQSGSRVGLRLGNFTPYISPARRNAEAILKNEAFNKPACAVVNELQKPIYSDPTWAAKEHFSSWAAAQKFVEHFTSLSRSDITQLAGTYCTARKIRGALSW